MLELAYLTTFPEDLDSLASFGTRVRTDSHRLSLSTGIITPPSTDSIAAPSPIPRPEPGLKVQAALIHYRKVPVFHSDKDFTLKT